MFLDDLSRRRTCHRVRWDTTLIRFTIFYLKGNRCMEATLAYWDKNDTIFSQNSHNILKIFSYCMMAILRRRTVRLRRIAIPKEQYQDMVLRNRNIFWNMGYSEWKLSSIQENIFELTIEHQQTCDSRCKELISRCYYRLWSHKPCEESQCFENAAYLTRSMQIPT